MTAAVQENLQSRMVELSGEAMDAFCEDIGTMFDATLSCTIKQQGPTTIDSLKKLFKKVCAIHTVKAEGILDGTFHLVFDQGGLFTLGGVVVMLPQARILEEAKKGSEKDAKAMSDSVGEVGNLLVGVWDRIFRKDLSGHKHFIKTGSFIGIPWTNPQATLGLPVDEELEFVLYEMNVAPYPAFSVAVVFPKRLMSPKTRSTEAEAAASVPEKAPSEDQSQTETEVEAQEVQEEPSSKPEAQSKKPKGLPSKKIKAKTQAESEPAPSPEVQMPSPPPEVPPPPEAVKVTPEPERPVPQPQTVPKDFGPTGVLNSPITQVMTREVVWTGPEESVLEVLKRMQQHDAGYALVGQNGCIEGLVSKSNVLGGISPYLRPVFAKWRRPEDDATLNIKIKWLMSRPVQTLGIQATLGQAIDRMQQFGGRCLPVVDEAGKVAGLVTVFDVFKALNPHTFQGKTPQAPCLMV